MENQDKYIMSKSDLEAIANYLASKPFAEVAHLMDLFKKATPLESKKDE